MLSDDGYFKDKFTSSQYYEFVKLLQEKSMLDSKRMAAENVQFSERIDFDNEPEAGKGVLYKNGFSSVEVHDFWRIFVNKTNGLAEFSPTL